MKILWVEDFGGKLAPSKIVVEIFKEIFEAGELKKIYDQDNPNVAGQLPELFRKHTLHEIHVCKSYVEWKRVDEQHGGDFDIALIDINLVSHPTSNEEMPAGIKHPDFDRRAGFYIYHQLIKRGFPDANIAFFTGEGQSLKEFTRFCGDIFLDRPTHCFEKNPTQFNQLRQWLSEKESQQSLILRRGVIEGCRFMKEQVRALGSQELEARLIFYKTTLRNINADPETYRRETIDYLTRLERFFLPYPNNEHAHPLYLFVRELAAKWEASYGHFIRAKEMPRFETRLEERFYNTAQFQMKLLRNWCVHDTLSPDLTPKEVAYFFMLAMRSWVEFDLAQILMHEKILSSLFSQLTYADLTREIRSRLEFYLEQSYGRLRTLYTDMKRHASEPLEYRKHDNYFLAAFKSLGEALELLDKDVFEFYKRELERASLRLFYQSYWHGLFPVYIKTFLYGNLQAVGVNLEPVPESFISFLGQLILKKSFREEGEEVLSENVA